MKNHLILSLLGIILSSFHASGQSDFAQVGTKWTYTEASPGVMPNSTVYMPYVMESVSEEVFEGKLCKKIIGLQPFFNFTFYVYSQNDSIFRWDGDNNRFNLLYDFTAEAGDSWDIEMPHFALGNGDTTINVLVDSVGFMVRNEDTLKVWYITYGEAADWGNTIIEGIGNYYFFIPLPDIFERCICGGVRCFESPHADYVFVDYPCDTIYTEVISGIEEISDSDQISIFPNPTSGQITLSPLTLNGVVLSLEIVDLTGKTVFSETFKNIGPRIIDTTQLPRGLYVLRLSEDGQTLKSIKLTVVR